jgi:hypothetical protein
MTNDDFERILKEVVAGQKYYPRIYLEGLRKDMNMLSGSWCHDRA